jgi:hypothetical protein
MLIRVYMFMLAVLGCYYNTGAHTQIYAAQPQISLTA